MRVICVSIYATSADSNGQTAANRYASLNFMLFFRWPKLC